MPPPLRATRGVAFYLVASAFTCRVCSVYSCNSIYSVMGGGQSTAHSSTICFYYTTIFFFCQVFYTTFLELFLFFSPLSEGTLCRPKVPFHPPRALARLRRSNSCFKQKGNFITFLLPNCSTYPRYSLLFSFSLSQVCSA